MDVAPSTPRGRGTRADSEMHMGPLMSGARSPAAAIVTSTRPASSTIILPPTPQLVLFDGAMD